jgi:hypothetical protein
MTHEDVFEQLDGFHRGTLDERAMAEMRAHLTDCEECRALARTYRVLQVSLSSEAGIAEEGHPASERIVAYAEDRNRLDPQLARSMADHLAACASCTEEVERTRRVAESIRERPELDSSGVIREPARTRSWSAWGALAAAVLLAAVAYPAYLGLFRLPSARQQAATLRSETTRLEADLERLRGWGGAVSLNVLPRTLRDGAEVATVTLEPDQPYAAIALELLVPRRVADEEILRFEIVGPGDEVIWSLEQNAATIRADIANWGVVTLIVPSARMEPGRHSLAVVSVDRPAEDPLLHVTFDLVPGVRQ